MSSNMPLLLNNGMCGQARLTMAHRKCNFNVTELFSTKIEYYSYVFDFVIKSSIANQCSTIFH